MNRRSTIGDVYSAYFQALIEVMTEQYHWDVTDRALQGDNYYPFLSGFSHIEYLAVFRGRGERRKVCTELRIAKKTDVFDALRRRKSEINAKFDAPLCWNPSLNPRMRTDLIRLQRNGDIIVDTLDANELADIKAWHIKTLREFKEAFTPEIRSVLEK